MITKISSIQQPRLQKTKQLNAPAPSFGKDLPGLIEQPFIHNNRPGFFKSLLTGYVLLSTLAAVATIYCVNMCPGYAIANFLKISNRQAGEIFAGCVGILGSNVLIAAKAKL